MCPYKYYHIMRQSKDKKQWRYQMAQKALEVGVKPAARMFNTSPPVVRKWLARFRSQGYSGLADRSRKPHHSPRETPRHFRTRPHLKNYHTKTSITCFVDLYVVQKLLGHSTIKMTERYAHLQARHLKDAISKLEKSGRILHDIGYNKDSVFGTNPEHCAFLGSDEEINVL